MPWNCGAHSISCLLVTPIQKKQTNKKIHKDIHASQEQIKFFKIFHDLRGDMCARCHFLEV